MKIVLNTQSDELLNEFVKLAKLNNVEILTGKAEKILFDLIIAGDVNAFIIENSTRYAQKAIDFIKKKHPYVPVILIGEQELDIINNADIYMMTSDNSTKFFKMILKSIVNYEKNFQSLKRLVLKTKNNIEFGNCVYDPNQRILYHNGKEIAKMSEKNGGILEVLATNYGKIVKKELILEKLWLKSDYFSGRSMDVYVSNIRTIFKTHNVDMVIKNVSKVGLILQ